MLLLLLVVIITYIFSIKHFKSKTKLTRDTWEVFSGQWAILGDSLNFYPLVKNSGENWSLWIVGIPLNELWTVCNKTRLINYASLLIIISSDYPYRSSHALSVSKSIAQQKTFFNFFFKETKKKNFFQISSLGALLRGSFLLSEIMRRLLEKLVLACVRACVCVCFCFCVCLRACGDSNARAGFLCTCLFTSELVYECAKLVCKGNVRLEFVREDCMQMCATVEDVCTCRWTNEVDVWNNVGWLGRTPAVLEWLI